LIKTNSFLNKKTLILRLVGDTCDNNVICFSSATIPSTVRLCRTPGRWSRLQERWQDGSSWAHV